MEKQVLSRVNSIEEGKLGLRNETEQRGRVESTLTSLHQRITDLEKGSPAWEEKGKGKKNTRPGLFHLSLSAHNTKSKLSFCCFTHKWSVFFFKKKCK